MEPLFNETGAVTPSLLPESKQEELIEVSKKMLKALGLTCGVMHVELKYTTTNGPQLIEVNSRMGGGPVRSMNLDVWGVDLVEEHLMTTVGLPSLPPVPEKPITCIGQYSVNAVRSGVVTEEIDAEVEKTRKLPNVKSVESFVAAGDRVVGLADGMPSWICDIMVEKDNAKEALAYVEDLASGFKQPIV
uniref:ATP-grasp domain-containing protein n=1 Tax=Chloropicon primus TaxID=1764295 RepID=A0A7S2WXH8_9CHLO